MPKFYCEYCNIYLTHSSPAGRRQHTNGKKHINAKIEYYQNLIREQGFQPPMYMGRGANARMPAPNIPIGNAAMLRAPMMVRGPFVPPTMQMQMRPNFPMPILYQPTDATSNMMLQRPNQFRPPIMPMQAAAAASMSNPMHMNGTVAIPGGVGRPPAAAV